MAENRLRDEISPYLLLHAHNPVDWYPWGEEALERARAEDKPIFLSVGYSTCYWCHVMERESFSDAGVARVMNRDFINIKVDREERPEIDEIYMAATQIFAQQGGWPNSVFLTPRLEPFFAGTYFPPVDMHGRPSFKTVLLSMKNAWDTRRDDVETQAGELAEAMQRMLEERGEPSPQVAAPVVAEESKRGLAGRFDAEYGGFGGAPKFPSPGNLFLLHDLASASSRGPAELDEQASATTMLETTLDAMARGGIYDQLAGGFHRYATDRAWKIPHFEKMLYDNGFLLELYALDFARGHDPDRRRIVLETARFLEREMTSPDGGLYSAIDAEVAGREGAYHVWTETELVDVLGEEDASFLAGLYGFDGPPFFDRSYYVLHLPQSWPEHAARRRVEVDALHAQVEPLRQALLAVREQRDAPAVDDKILADWNGIAITGLAVAGDLLEERRLVEQARRAADFVLAHHVLAQDRIAGQDGAASLRHSWRAGEARFDAFLADYVFLTRGLLALHDATGEARWLETAAALTDEQIARLEDRDQGGFFTAGDSPEVLFRSKEIFDGALPSANAVAVLNLLTLAEKSAGDERVRWLDVAERTLRAFTVYCERAPDAARMLTLAAHRWHRLAGLRVAVRHEGVETGLDVGALVGDAARAVVDASLTVDPRASDEGWRTFRLQLQIKSSWHLYAHRPYPAETGTAPGPEVVPTTLAGPPLRAVVWPAGEPLGVADGAPSDPAGSDVPQAYQSPQVYQSTVEIVGELQSDAVRPTLTVCYQACDDRRCLPPVELTVDGVDEDPAH
ncbi:MAG: thioredoxin domain-containing protein [Acidobacteriota bacterium]